jgi:hypothetical protein
MKKRIIGVFLFLFSYLTFFAQITWFKIHDLGFEVEDAYKIVPFGNDNIVLVENNDPTPPKTRNQVLRIDANGEIQWRIFLNYPVSAYADLQVYRPRDIIVAKDSSIYATSVSRNWDSEQEILVNKFTKNGELIWFKTYGITGNSLNVTSGYEGISLSEDSLGLFIAGNEFLTKNLVVCKIDSAGNQVFTKIVNVPIAGNVGQITPTVRMPDSTYKVAYDNNIVLDYRDYLASVDSAGILEYSFINPFTGKTHDLALHPNGNLVYLSNERNPPMGEWGGLRIQMLTPDFDTIWSHLFYDTEFPYLFLETAFVRNLSISPDGKILAMGYNTTNCILLCYDEHSVLLWKREVALEGFVEALKFNYVSWTSDGGILLDGYLYKTLNGDEYDAQIFLLKLDSLGCFLPGCDQSVITNIKEISLADSLFEISPNPTTGLFTVAYTGNNWNKISDSAIQVHNTDGALVFQCLFHEKVVTIDLSNTQAGVYHLTVRTGQGERHTTKIIKM